MVYSKGRNSHIGMSPDEAKQRHLEDKLCDDELFLDQENIDFDEAPFDIEEDLSRPFKMGEQEEEVFKQIEKTEEALH